jgi:glycosyltransferase 2 family protein
MFKNLMSKIIQYRKKIILGLQLAVSFILLFYLLKKVDLSTFFSELASVEFSWFSIYLLSYLLSIFFVAFKWWKLLELNGFKRGYFSIVKINWIGFFYNQFLPGRIGGDAMKILYLVKEEKEKSKLSVSVVMDRVFNLVGVLLVAYFAIFINYLESKEYILPVIIITAIVIVAFIVLKLSIPWLQAYQTEKKNFQRLIRLIVSSYMYLSNSKVNKIMILYSLIYVINIVVMHYLLSQAMGLNLDFKYYLFFVPIVTAVTMIPISFGGLGVREVSFVLMLSQVGISNEKAIAFSLIMYISILFFSIPGFFFQFFSLKSTNDVDNQR